MANRQSPVIRKTVHLHCLEKKEDCQDSSPKRTTANPTLKQIIIKGQDRKHETSQPSCSHSNAAPEVVHSDPGEESEDVDLDSHEEPTREEEQSRGAEGEMSETEKIMFSNTKVAPTELLMEFFECLVSKDYAMASKLCEMILLYEPKNKEALEFRDVLKERISLDADKSNDDDDDDEEDDDDDDDEEEEDDDDTVKSSDEDEDEDEDEDDTSDEDEDEKKRGREIAEGKASSERSGDSGLNSGASSSLDYRSSSAESPSSKSKSSKAIGDVGSTAKSDSLPKPKGATLNSTTRDAGASNSRPSSSQSSSSRRDIASSSKTANSSSGGRTAYAYAYSAGSRGTSAAGQRSLKSSTVTPTAK